VLFQRGVVGFRRGHVGLEQHPSVDGQPPSIKGLDLVRDGDVGVQIRILGTAVSVGERGRDQASDVDLTDALWPGPSEQGLLLDECKRVLHGGRHVAQFVLYTVEGEVDVAFPPTGKTFTMTQSHWFRLKDGKILEHWANRDDLGHAQQLGWLPPTPRYLIRMARAKRRTKRQLNT
jgi:hypothetical protein